jgi:hypothetical protein
MLTEAMVQHARLRAEALYECRKDAHGYPRRCNQFLIWTERGGTGRGAWDACRSEGHFD